jgi:hypothetical protein
VIQKCLCIFGMRFKSPCATLRISLRRGMRFKSPCAHKRPRRRNWRVYHVTDLDRHVPSAVPWTVCNSQLLQVQFYIINDKGWLSTARLCSGRPTSVPGKASIFILGTKKGRPEGSHSSQLGLSASDKGGQRLKLSTSIRYNTELQNAWDVPTRRISTPWRCCAETQRWFSSNIIC